ncbi:hypothetical protein ACFYO0_12860 [Streptomyces sp. NPDC006365]
MDVKPVLNWVAYTKGWMPGNETIGDVRFGHEITSSVRVDSTSTPTT